jgi:RNA polymerase sigma factor (sigma-70 family)
VSRDDSALIQACLAGNAAAWNELVDRFGRLVYSVPRRYGLSAADADDVFQSVFTLLFRRLGALRDHSRLSSWLITTAHRESWRVGKKSGSNPNLDQQIADVGSPPDDAAERWEQQHLVRKSLEELGGRCEELLSALFMDSSEPSYDQIAVKLGIPVGSIGPTRTRCFEKLEAILRRNGI